MKGFADIQRQEPQKWLAKEEIRTHVGKCEYSHLLSQQPNHSSKSLRAVFWISGPLSADMLVVDENPFALPCLPAGFLYARDLAFVCQLTEADSANSIFSQVCMRTTADSAAIILSGGEFLLTLLFDFH